MNQYPDIQEDIEQIATDREKDRLRRQNQKSLLEEDEVKFQILEELQELLARDLNQIKNDDTNRALYRKRTKIFAQTGERMTAEELFTAKLFSHSIKKLDSLKSIKSVLGNQISRTMFQNKSKFMKTLRIENAPKKGFKDFKIRV